MSDGPGRLRLPTWIAAALAVVVGAVVILSRPGERSSAEPGLALDRPPAPPEALSTSATLEGGPRPVAPVAQEGRVAPTDPAAPSAAPAGSPVADTALRIEGLVLDPSGAPVAGALASVAADGPGTPSDGAGRFRLPLDAARPLPRRLAVHHPRFVPWHRTLDLAPADFVDGAHSVEVRLEAGVALRVEVTDEQLAALEGALVLARNGSSGSWGNLPGVWEELQGVARGARLAGASVAPTDAAGSVELIVRPGRLPLAVEHPRYLPWRDTLDLAADGASAVVQVRLVRGEGFAGRVVDPDGGPVPEAAVYGYARGRDLHAATDASGRFALSGLPANTRQVELLVLADGWAPAVFPRQPLGEGELVLDLGPGATLRLDCRDALEGPPPAGRARVELGLPLHGEADALRERLTTKLVRELVDGRLTLERVPAELRSLFLQVEGYEPALWTAVGVEHGAQLDVALDLLPVRPLEIVVLDAVTKEPVAGADVRIVLVGREQRVRTESARPEEVEGEPGHFRFDSRILSVRLGPELMRGDEGWVRVFRRGYRPARVTYFTDGAEPPATLTVWLDEDE